MDSHSSVPLPRERLRFALWKGAGWRNIRNGVRSRVRSRLSKNDQNKFKNGIYISGLSLLNTCVRLLETRSDESPLLTTLVTHRKSRLAK